LFVLLGWAISKATIPVEDGVVDSLNRLTTAARDINALKALNVLVKKTMNDPKTAMQYAEKAIELAQELKDSTRWALSVNQVALAWYYQGELKKCRTSLEEALRIYTLLNNEKGIAIALNGIGVIHYDQGRLEEALNYYLRSLDIKEKGDDLYAIAMTVNNIGNVHKDLGNFEKSREYYNRSLEMKEQIDDKYGTAMTLNNIGLLHSDHKKYSKALEYYEKSLVIKEEIDDLHGLAMTINNIGLVYEHLEEWDKALESYGRSIQLKEQINDQFGLAMTLINTGAVYKNMGDFTTAIEYLEKALHIAIAISSEAQKRDVYLRLSETYEAMGNGISSLEYYKLFTAIKDNMINEAGMKRIAEMEAIYENKKNQQKIQHLTKEKQLQTATSKKDRIIIYAFTGGFILIALLSFYLFKNYRQKQKVNEQLKDRVELKDLELSDIIKQLKQEIEEHKKTQKKLETINAELNNFMYRSSHDLKGPLASIIGITNAVRQGHFEKERHDHLELITQSANRLNIILDTLLEATRVTHSKIEVSLIEFDDFIKKIVKSLENAEYSKHITVEIAANEGLRFYSDKNLLNTVMQNLIDNAMKYKNPSIEDPYVKIKAEKQGNGIRIIVSDNGQGIPEDQQTKVFDMFVRANLESEGTGLGLYIVKKTIDKLRGTITLKSEEGIGTTFNIVLPDQRLLQTHESSKESYINN